MCLPNKNVLIRMKSAADTLLAAVLLLDQKSASALDIDQIASEGQSGFSSFALTFKPGPRAAGRLEGRIQPARLHHKSESLIGAA
jgi:hypothetical protein